MLTDLLCTSELREDVAAFIRYSWNMTLAELLKLIDQIPGDVVLFLQE